MNINAIARILQNRFNVPVLKVIDGCNESDGLIKVTERVAISTDDGYMMAGRERRDGTFVFYPVRDITAQGFVSVNGDIESLLREEIEDAKVHCA